MGRHPFVAILFVLYLFGQATGSEKSYGAYRAIVHNYTQCKTTGMDRRPLTSNVTWVKHPNGTDALYVTAIVRRTLGPFGIRLRVAKLDPATKEFRSLMNYKIKDICAGFFAEEILKLFPLFEKNCTVAEGSFSMLLPDMDHVLHQLTGSSFYYGTYQSMYELTAVGVGSCMCTNLYVIYTPIE